MITSAGWIHALLHSLGAEKARVVGHDIGLTVAYAYAATFPSETEKRALMDAFLSGVEGWEPIYDSPDYWPRFHGPTPEAHAWLHTRRKSVSAGNRGSVAARSKSGRASAVEKFSRLKIFGELRLKFPGLDSE